MEEQKKRGRPPKEVYTCYRCGEQYTETFISSGSFFNKKKVPWCKKCIDGLYREYVDKYSGCSDPKREATKRMCMALDMYYSDSLYKAALKKMSSTSGISLFASFYQIINLAQYKNKSYDDTLREIHGIVSVESKSDSNIDEKSVPKKVQKFFGTGFSYDDYIFLQNEYEDWTTRHECSSKSQEEIFKQICFTQLDIYKARLNGNDTKDLTATLQKLLDTAKLQPKQNSNETVSESQTFGTLLDKWENTRPTPDIDDDLKDVDKIGLYIDVFFRGHLAKLVNLKNGLSNLYDKFIGKYTVKKPEYNDEENGEAIFDAIFGNNDL